MQARATLSSHTYLTQGGVRVERTTRAVDAGPARAQLARALDTRRGLLLSSSYEYPGRYKRYDYGFSDPPLALTASALSRALELRALSARGVPLLAACQAVLAALPELCELHTEARSLRARVREPDTSFAEEDRTRIPSVFSALRALCGLFGSDEDRLLGLYGAFGYDLVFQFEALEPRLPRSPRQRDLVLYLPDEILVIDHAQEQAFVHSYDFELGAARTHGLAREPVLAEPASPATEPPSGRAAQPFREIVARARGAFARGDLFEATPSQRFERSCSAEPSQLFERLRQRNPAPYGFVANLGQGEVLIGASPEMYVRVSGRRVETCPIAGTIARGQDAFGDARQILSLLSSEKDEAELTMCTDVDRNDKARICEPGSVRVIGRRQIELYSRLIHTVDHVEGRLREGFDALDAFLTHMWAVTVTGAPKLDAMQFIEDCEASPRGYYGGAIGVLRFDGSLDSGLVLRTVRLQHGIAQVRAGATLHFDSDPRAEEAETELKASALIGVLEELAETPLPAQPPPPAARASARALRVLLIDHRDSFVHTLSDYFRQAGCVVSTVRHDRALSHYARVRPELVVLSPGPARPDDFGMRACLDELAARGVPVFGVCLGLQGMVEHAGGELAQLALPMHGKPSDITCDESPLFRGLPRRFTVGRYHSLYAVAGRMPASLRTLARTDDACCMAIAHASLPWTAVQFHPESILSAENAHGLALIQNVVEQARSHARQG